MRLESRALKHGCYFEILTVNLAVPAGRESKRGGFPSRHGAEPLARNHSPILELRNSGQVFQKEGETRTETVRRLPSDMSTRVTRDHVRRKNLSLSAEPTLSP
jgi:hypothetical protein